MGIDNRASGQGEFRGDFTRDSFDVTKHFSRVFLQQGRVQIDADWNEQTSILLHYLRSLAADLIGPHGGPAGGLGFALSNATLKDGTLSFEVGAGRYWVDGYLCEAEEGTTFALDAELEGVGFYVVFLDVWERHIAANEDVDLAEVALGGPDTASRAQVAWRLVLSGKWDNKGTPAADDVPGIQKSTFPSPTATLQVRAKFDKKREPCAVAPEARYRGPENQLYRIEIHGGGAVGEATFKWSRENGSVTFPIRSLQGASVKLDSLGRDGRLGLRRGDWVEVVDDERASRGAVGELRQVVQVDREEMTVMLSEAASESYEGGKGLQLRRWDYSNANGDLGEDNAVVVVEGEWITLEDGVQIRFGEGAAGAVTNELNVYRAGDYWLAPARVATGDVLWPGTDDAPRSQPPHGVEHHYAALGVVEVSSDGSAKLLSSPSLRREFGPLASSS